MKVIFLMLSIPLSAVVRFIPFFTSVFSGSFDVVNEFIVVFTWFTSVPISFAVKASSISVNGCTVIYPHRWFVSVV